MLGGNGDIDKVGVGYGGGGDGAGERGQGRIGAADGGVDRVGVKQLREHGGNLGGSRKIERRVLRRDLVADCIGHAGGVLRGEEKVEIEPRGHDEGQGGQDDHPAAPGQGSEQTDRRDVGKLKFRLLFHTYTSSTMTASTEIPVRPSESVYW